MRRVVEVAYLLGDAALAATFTPLAAAQERIAASSALPLVFATRRRPGTSSRRQLDCPRTINEGLQCFRQRLRVAAGQVDLVGRAIEREQDCLIRLLPR